MNILLIHHNRPNNLFKQLTCIQDSDYTHEINIYLWLNTKSTDEVTTKFLPIINSFNIKINLLLSDYYRKSPSESILAAITKFFEIVEFGIIIEDDCIFDKSLFITYSKLLKNHLKLPAVLCFSYFGSEDIQQKILRFRHFIGWGWYTNRALWINFYKAKNSNIITYFKFIKNISSLGFLPFIYWTLIFIFNKFKRFNSWDYDFYIFILSNNNMYSFYFINKNLFSNIGADGLGYRVNSHDKSLIYNKIDNNKSDEIIVSHDYDYNYDLYLEKRFFSYLFFRRLPKNFFKILINYFN